MNKKTKKKILFTLATKLGWLIIILFGKLSFIKFVNRKYWRRLKEQNKNFIFIVWHGRILLPIFVHRNENVTGMVSLHDDGEMIAVTLHRLGYKTVRGSSTRGGKQAFNDMVNALKQSGNYGAIMPDGPRGPRHKFKAGALYIAQKSGAYLLPVTFASKKKIEFKSWDRFNLVTPFSKAVVIYGQPIKVSEKLSPKEMVLLRKDVERLMNEYEQQADDYFKK